MKPKPWSPCELIIEIASNPSRTPNNGVFPSMFLRANTINQMEQFLGDLFNLPNNTPERSGGEESNLQTRAAIEAVLNGERWVDLPPANATIRRLQHEMARQAQLVSQSFGKEPNRRVRIYRD